MDRIVRWIDGNDELRASLVEAGNLEKFLRELHEVPADEVQPFFQTVLGTLLFAQDQKTHQTLSLQVEHAGRAWHCDATMEGLARAMTTKSRWMEPGFRISVRRLGQKGLIYQSVVESKENSVLLALREYLEVSEQSPAHLSCFIEPATRRAEAFLLRGFPKTPIETLSKALVATDAMDPSTPIRELLTAANPGRWDILNEVAIEHHCPCNRLRAMASLATLGAAELEEAAANVGELDVNCEFCRTRYVYNATELLELAQMLNAESPE